MFKKTREKINNNKYIVFIKKLWANKKYRSLLILALYFIFFFIIISGLRSSYQNADNLDKENSVSVKEMINTQYKELDNYSYEVILNNQTVIIGSLDSEINNFIYNDQNFTVILDNVYLNKNDDLKKVELEEYNEMLVPINSLFVSNIMDYIVTLEPVSEEDTDRYNAIYEIPYSYFSIESDDVVQINIKGSDKIEEISFDLTEYFKEEYKIIYKIGDELDAN